MRLSLLLPILLLLTACSTTPEINVSDGKVTEQKIQSNQSIASDAKDEYKKLQAQREKE